VRTANDDVDQFELDPIEVDSTQPYKL